MTTTANTVNETISFNRDTILWILTIMSTFTATILSVTKVMEFIKNKAKIKIDARIVLYFDCEVLPFIPGYFIRLTIRNKSNVPVRILDTYIMAEDNECINQWRANYTEEVYDNIQISDEGIVLLLYSFPILILHKNDILQRKFIIKEHDAFSGTAIFCGNHRATMGKRCFLFVVTSAKTYKIKLKAFPMVQDATSSQEQGKQHRIRD